MPFLCFPEAEKLLSDLAIYARKRWTNDAVLAEADGLVLRREGIEGIDEVAQLAREGKDRGCFFKSFLSITGKKEDQRHDCFELPYF